VQTYNERGSGCTAAYGCGQHKKTVVINGDVTYRDRVAKQESGKAAEITEGCEETITTTESCYGSGDAIQPIVSVTV
jgi:hypothetical protein